MSTPTPALFAARFRWPPAPRHAVPRPALVARLKDGLAAGLFHVFQMFPFLPETARAVGQVVELVASLPEPAWMNLIAARHAVETQDGRGWPPPAERPAQGW